MAMHRPRRCWRRWPRRVTARLSWAGWKTRPSKTRRTLSFAAAQIRYRSRAGCAVGGAWKVLRAHAATMDTLIALGTGTAWLYSMLVVAFPALVPSLARHAYFETAAVIIALANLGQALAAGRAAHDPRAG